MTIFDAPSREVCMVRRERTNTPLQALLMMNEVQYLTAARHLAQNVIEQTGPSPEDRARRMFLWATAREPNKRELNILLSNYRQQLEHYRRDILAAADLNQGGQGEDAFVSADEFAAWTVVGNLILNLDEVLTKG